MSTKTNNGKHFAGKVFGRLTVSHRLTGKGPTAMWHCLCACGGTAAVRRNVLVKGRRKFCDQSRHVDEMREIRRRAAASYRTYGTPEESDVAGIWAGMVCRCGVPSGSSYADYGGRGIKVCERWFDFGAFFSDMGPRPSPKHLIERLDVDGGYEPGNCVWATAREQSRNQRRTRWVERAGERKKLVDVCEEEGKSLALVGSRMRVGWSSDDAVDTPKGQHRPTWSSKAKRQAKTPTGRKNKPLFVEWRGESRRLADVCREAGVALSRTTSRIGLGWSVERAVTEPPRRRGERRVWVYPEDRCAIEPSNDAPANSLDLPGASG